MQKTLLKRFISLVQGGVVTSGPPIGPLCGRYVKNLKTFIDEINQLTKPYLKKKVYVELLIYDDKSYDISIYKLPIGTELLEKVSGGKIFEKDIEEIAKKRFPLLTNSHSLNSFIKEIKGTVNSMRIKIIK
jgi:ribosomal protein L11